MNPELLSVLRAIADKSRVHNSDDLDYCFNILHTYCDTHMRGNITVHRYKPGESYNHWIIPPRWNVKSFRLIAPDGSIIVDEHSHPLAVGCYSCSVDTELTLEELKERVTVNENTPDAYVFHFRRMYRHWEKDWSLSLPLNELNKLPSGNYRVVIDVDTTDEPMGVFEYCLPGTSEQTIFLCGHIDHPGMVNDSLSGCFACLEAIARIEATLKETRFTYRILLVPEIIGSAVYLKDNEELIKTSLFGLCPNMTAHDAPIALCNSKSGQSLLDFALHLAVAETTQDYEVAPFHKHPDCGDEISFDATGYRIPTPTLSRIGQRFQFYHTSHDNIDWFSDEAQLKRHAEIVQCMFKGLHFVESNFEMSARFQGNPCLSNPALDLYLNPSNLNNLEIPENSITNFDGSPIDLRNFMEFFLDALDTEGISVLDIAYHARLPYDFVYSYAQKFAETDLVSASPCIRQKGLTNVSSTSLELAGLL